MLRSLGCGRLEAFDLRVNKWLFGAVLFSLVLHFVLLSSPFAVHFGFVPFSSLHLSHFMYVLGLPLIGYVL